MQRNLALVSTVLFASLFLAIVSQSAAMMRPCRHRQDYRNNTAFGLYKFHNEALTWNDARKACSDEGAHLAILNSADEELALRTLFSHNIGSIHDDAINKDLAWLGYHDYFREGDFATILGNPVHKTEYDPWSKNCFEGKIQPDNTLRKGDEEPQNCGALIQSCGNLDDSWCDEKLAFICEC